MSLIKIRIKKKKWHEGIWDIKEEREDDASKKCPKSL